MSKKLNFDAMSVDDMWALHEEIGRILSERLAQEKRELERRLEQLRAEKEARANDRHRAPLTRTPQVRRKYPRVYPKYCNPDEPSETWSGRGKKPRWLVSAIGSGRTIEEFAINEAEPAVAAKAPRMAVVRQLNTEIETTGNNQESQ